MKRHILAAAVLASTLTGCGMIGQPQDAGGGEEKVQAQAQQTESQQAAPDQKQSAAPQGEDVIASKRIQDKGATIRVDVLQLQRQGKMAVLDWKITVEKGAYWTVGVKMGQHNTDYTVSNVSLIDTRNSKRYRVARSEGEQGTCACTKTDATTVQRGGAQPFQAMFAAPPPEITKINVSLGELGGLTNVPIS
jgi:hypothetical protein